ncbi:MAG: hypothetical protein QXO67_02800 [Candidatus Bathyarchaeia archaeon]
MVTHGEVRRAIFWGERWLEHAIQPLTWNGKTYKIIKGYPAFPLTLKLYKVPPEYAYAYQILGPPFPVSGVGGTPLTWYETWKVLETIVNTFEVWEAKIQFGMTLNLEEIIGTKLWCPVADFRCRYEPDPDRRSRMKATITLEEWYDSFKLAGNADAYFNGEKIITDCMGSAPAKPTVVRYTPDWGYFPSVSYWGEETLLASYYYWYVKLRRGDVYPYMTNFLDDFGYYIWQFGPMHLGIRDNYPDDYVWSWDNYHSCDVWDNLPKTENFFPFQSGVCPQKGLLLEFFKCMKDSYREWVFAIHIMNKYNPDHVHLLPTADPISGQIYVQEITPRKMVYEGWYECTGEKVPSVMECCDKFLSELEAGEPVPHVPHFIQILSILGYGYGDKTAQEMADALVEAYLPAQWGYPFTPGKEGEYTDEVYGTVWRPDLAGAFLGAFKKEGSYVSVPYTRLTSFWRRLYETIYEPMPPPQPTIPFRRAWTEGQFQVLAALRVYEYYKWRLR